MYIPRYKRRKILHWIVAIVIIIFISWVLNRMWYDFYSTNENAIRRMDIQEKHYDSDGPFIMISIEDHLIGYYIGTIPIVHYEYTDEIENGIYNVFYDEYSESFKLTTRTGNIIGYIETHNNIELINNFNDSIALVYNGEKHNKLD